MLVNNINRPVDGINKLYIDNIYRHCTDRIHTKQTVELLTYQPIIQTNQLIIVTVSSRHYQQTIQTV